MKIVCGTIYFLLLTLTIHGETPPLAAQGDPSKNIETLEVMFPAIRVAEQELADARAELAKADTDESKKEIGKRIDTLRERSAQLRANFRTIATGTEDHAYNSETETPSNFESDIRELMRPVLTEIREATAKPREMEQIRSALREWQARLELSEGALRRIDLLTPELTSGSQITGELNAVRKLWTNRREESLSQTRTLELQIEERERNTPSMWQAVSQGVATFWRSRGFNLLLGVSMGLFLFIAIRKVWSVARKWGPLRHKKRIVFSKLADIVAMAVSVITGVFAVMLVFYLRGDWLLLTLVVIVLLGILWASKRTLPLYVEQFKTMLDLGAVRTGERLVYDGIPWRVDSLNFFCTFSNPDLRDGVLRLPIREVIPLHSRPSEEKESWFPTREGDWVKLKDGTFGKVVLQTPEQTTVLRLGGSRKSYRTADYLDQHPENLSAGFRVSTIFGIDYRHFADGLKTVPGVFQEQIMTDLLDLVDHEAVKSVKVEFANASPSSVDFEIMADFDGAVAARFNVIHRQLQASCAKACHTQGWNIPFPQLVVHQEGH